MKARTPRAYVGSILVCVLMSFVIGSAIGQTQQMRLEDLAKKAEAIVVGKVSNVKSEWNKEKTRIYTKVTVDVGEYVKGETADKTLVITQLGGEVDGVGELYSHTPRFSKEEEVLLFVKKDKKNNIVIEGGEQGKYKIMMNGPNGEKTVEGGLTLRVFTSRVKSILQHQERD
jgi:hypothetical protein